jgi:hypothetical protein
MGVQAKLAAHVAQSTKQEHAIFDSFLWLACKRRARTCNCAALPCATGEDTYETGVGWSNYF